MTLKTNACISAVALVFTLAACGGPAEEEFATPEAAASVTEAVAATDAAVEATPTDATATPTAEASATPTPTASASPSAAASAKPMVAAAAPPAPAGPPAAFAVCSACHKVAPGRNGIGPSLAGVFGAKAGHLGDGFKYSEAMLESGLTWNQANLDRYLENPRGVVPGTTMSFGGVKDDAKRADIIAYLRGL